MGAWDAIARAMPSMRRGYLSNKEFLVDPEFSFHAHAGH
jgi:hypothetical protein